MIFTAARVSATLDRCREMSRRSSSIAPVSVSCASSRTAPLVPNPQRDRLADGFLVDSLEFQDGGPLVTVRHGSTNAAMPCIAGPTGRRFQRSSISSDPGEGGDERPAGRTAVPVLCSDERLGNLDHSSTVSVSRQCSRSAQSSGTRPAGPGTV